MKDHKDASCRLMGADLLIYFIFACYRKHPLIFIGPSQRGREVWICQALITGLTGETVV